MGNDTLLFTVNTRMDKDDYRNFLYFTSFRKNPSTILLILLFSGAGAAFGAYYGDMLTPVKFFSLWLAIAGLSAAAVCFRVETKTMQRAASERSYTFGAPQTLEFYETKIQITDEAVSGKAKVRYDQFFRVIETKQYYYLYHNESMASMIRKVDVEDPASLSLFFQKKFTDRYRVKK